MRRAPRGLYDGIPAALAAPTYSVYTSSLVWYAVISRSILLGCVSLHDSISSCINCTQKVALGEFSGMTYSTNTLTGTSRLLSSLCNRGSAE